MPGDSLLTRAGLGGGNLDAGFVRKLLAVLAAIYAVSFLAFYPSGPTNDDEAKYIQQSRLLLQGSTTIAKIDPSSGETVRYEPSHYPAGTALIMAPFVAVFGWRGAFLAPCICLLLGVLFTARWLAADRRSPLFAAVVLVFPASLVLGRVPTSDVPSLTAVALGLWLFWRGIERGPSSWIAAGFVAGVSSLIRESNVLLFVPFFAGTVLRREVKSWALIVGGLLGVGVRLVAAQIAFDDPLFVKAGYRFAFETIGERLPLYLLGLLVFVPGGLLAGLCYRGRRRPELVATVVFFVLFYLLQPYGMTASGLSKRLVIALRYFIPLLPVLAFALAEVLPRVLRSARERLSGSGRARLDALATAALVLFIAGTGVASAVVHPVFDRWASTQARIREAIAEHTGTDSVIIVNWFGTRKHLEPLDRSYVSLHRRELGADEVAVLAQRYDDVFVVFVDRTDSAYWREVTVENDAFVASLRPPPALELDRRVTATDRLRIWRVGGKSPEP